MKKTQVVQEGIDPNNFDDKELPSDVHIITYELEGTVTYDAVRAYTMVDIFDDYYDLAAYSNKLTVKQIRQLIAKYALS